MICHRIVIVVKIFIIGVERLLLLRTTTRQCLHHCTQGRTLQVILHELQRSQSQLSLKNRTPSFTLKQLIVERKSVNGRTNRLHSGPNGATGQYEIYNLKLMSVR